MEIILVGILTFIIGIIAGWFIKTHLSTGGKSSKDIRKEYENRINVLENENRELNMRAVSAEKGESLIKDQLLKLEDAQKKEQERERLEKENETKVLQTLAPINETLKQVGRKINDLESDRKEQYGGLQKQIENTFKQNQKLLDTTQTLSTALHASDKRGKWGEAQLKNIIESVGLMEHVDFDTQSSFEGEDNKTIRPDMIVYLPGEKCILIDSKVPCEAYLKAYEITDLSIKENIARRDDLLKKHATDLRNHIKKLSDKKYGENIPGAPDFVIAFIPSEAILSSAIKNDAALLEFGFQNRVVLASPSTLWAVIKTISFSWQQEAISKEAEKIFMLSKELYDRIGVIINHSISLGGSLDKSVDNYNKFVSSLERNVLSTTKKINKLGNFNEIKNIKPISNKTKDFQQKTINELTEKKPEN